MPSNFLDLHIVDFCQLNCKHCYLKKGKRVMPLDMLRAISEDFLKTDFPFHEASSSSAVVNLYCTQNM